MRFYMKMGIFLSFFLLFLIPISGIFFVLPSMNVNGPDFTPISILASDEPYNMQNNTWLQLNSSGGTGNKGDPYIFQLKNINTTELLTYEPCFLINNTDKYFAIQNCSCYNTGGPNIYLENVSNGIIQFNNFSHGSNIVLYNCTNVNITINNIYQGLSGINVSNSRDCFIIQNTITEISYHGIVVMLNSETITLSNNTITDGPDTGSPFGVLVLDSVQINMNDNTITDNGGYGISVQRSNLSRIDGNEITDNEDTGMTLIEAPNSTIVNNNILWNKWGGVVIADDSDNLTLFNNNITHNRYIGLDLCGISHNITLNTLTDNGLQGICIDANYSDFYNNTITNNGMEGIVVNTRSHHDEFHYNTISYNGKYGIQLVGGSHDNNVTYNTIHYNTMNGILDSGTNNIITPNDVIDYPPESTTLPPAIPGFEILFILLGLGMVVLLCFPRRTLRKKS
ncbi:MAG: right-handed parallel beta-helix repeat-containing protein [Candidatus Helarchaeota archaeon]